MYPTLNFNETVTIYPVTHNDYGKDVLGDGEEMLGMFEQTTGFEHSNNQDAVTGTSRVYLPPDNDFIIDHHYRLEGMVIKVNPFDAEDADQYFRIVSVTPGRDILRSNKVRHIECELSKTTDFDNEA